jgi:DNA-binding LytR/AlgR family response regulator
MSTRESQDQKAIAREMFVQQAAHAKADVSTSPPRGDTICSIKNRREYTLESTAEDGFYEPVDTLLVTRVDVIRALQQLEIIAKRQAPRIAFKAKGRILFLNLAEIVAVQAEGNYVSLRHPPNP